jgi:hypothetical protein
MYVCDLRNLNTEEDKAQVWAVVPYEKNKVGKAVP